MSGDAEINKTQVAGSGAHSFVGGKGRQLGKLTQTPLSSKFNL